MKQRLCLAMAACLVVLIQGACAEDSPAISDRDGSVFFSDARSPDASSTCPGGGCPSEDGGRDAAPADGPMPSDGSAHLDGSARLDGPTQADTSTPPDTSVDAAPAPPPGYTPVPPARVLDTRSSAPIGVGATKCVTVAGKFGIPSTAKAVFVNLAAVAPAGNGFVIAYPQGSPKPSAWTLVYQAGLAVSNGALVAVGNNGQICAYVDITATHLIIDVAGYMPAGASYFSVANVRKIDTSLNSGSTTCVQVAGKDGVPATAKAVAVNITVGGTATKPGYVIAFPKGPAPATSNVNYAASEVLANGAIVDVGTGGQICVFVLEATHLLLDVVGYFGLDARYTALPPFRKLDTRQGTLPAKDSSTCIQVAGSNGIPSSAKTVAVNVVAINASQAGYITLYAAGQSLPSTSTLNYHPSTVRANNALVELGSGKLCIYRLTATHYALDIVGYW